MVSLFHSDYRYYYLCLAFLALVLYLDDAALSGGGGR